MASITSLLDLCSESIVEISAFIDYVSWFVFASTCKRLWSLRHKTKLKNAETLGTLRRQRRWNWGLLLAHALEDSMFISEFKKKGMNYYAEVGQQYVQLKDGVKYFLQREPFPLCAPVMFERMFQSGPVNRNSRYWKDREQDLHVFRRSFFTDPKSSQVYFIEMSVFGGNQALINEALKNARWSVQQMNGVDGAAAAGDFARVDFFLNKKPDKHILNCALVSAVCYHSFSGLSPYATENNMLQYLIDKGADDWKKALAMSIHYEDIELAEFFVKKMKDTSYDYCIDRAREEGFEELFHYFKKKQRIEVCIDKLQDQPVQTPKETSSIVTVLKVMLMMYLVLFLSVLW